MWYKNTIRYLIGPYKAEAPYSWWNEALFSDTRPSLLPAELPEYLRDPAIVVGVVERAMRSAHVWLDDNPTRQRALLQTKIVVLMYTCLVYPRETVVVRLAEVLPEDSNERRICRELARVDNQFRHIRNAIAHGGFSFTKLDQSERSQLAVEFRDRNWCVVLRGDEVLLLSMLVFDVMMSAWLRQSPE